jgi:formiminoglutamase
MDILDYFDPVNFSDLTESHTFKKYSMGPEIADATKKLTNSNIQDYDIAIVGAPFDDGIYSGKTFSAPDKIRNQLYCLASPGKKITIADFGNLKPAKSKKGTLLAIRDITDFFNASKIVPVFIGGSQDLTAGICDAFKNEDFFTLSNIDAVLDVKKGVEQFNSSNYLSAIFKSLPKIFQFNLIGYQNHLVGEKLTGKYSRYGEYLRLGQLRDNFLQSEPLLRNSNVISLDMGVVNYTTAPGSGQKNPNGLRGEEVCQLARFAGMSNNLKVFGLFELYPAKDKNNITIKLAGEIIWYFLDGFINKPDSEKKIIYKVNINGLEQPVIFLQDSLSGRWWYEIKSVSGKKIHIACSENEYFKAANNEIPGKWLKFVQKMDALSK